jgi:hypothetical protein
VLNEGYDRLDGVYIEETDNTYTTLAEEHI